MNNIYYILSISLTLFILSCDQNNDIAFRETADTGVGGSYARFIIVNDFMYIVDDTSIKTFSLDNPEAPQEIDQKPIGERIESIFHYDSRLFIGSGAGLFIYQIEADGKPSQISATPYFESWDLYRCDPVVTNDSFAYVTLNSLDRINRCGNTLEININELRIYNIVDLTEPELLATFQMNAPKGVGLDGQILFICDDTAGLKIFDVSNPLDIQLIQQFDNFTAFDVIPLDGLLLVVGPDNVYQFDYNDLDNIQLISQIPYGA